MSATPAPDVERTLEHSQPQDVTPVRIDAEGLESTAPGYLRDLRRDLGEQGVSPAGLEVRARFEADCSLETQTEAERIRKYVRAAAFLGAGSVTVRVGEVADESKVRPALEACAERARREGISLAVEGPVSIE